VMRNITRLSDAREVATTAVDRAVQILSDAVSSYGSATWILAGGTSPMLAYEILHERADEIDWSRITIGIGDERMVPLDDTDSNWGAILEVLQRDVRLRNIQTLAPPVSLSPDVAASDYESRILELPRDSVGRPRLDLVWIGMGEDGHTLSLFPGHKGSEPTDRLVIPVYDSPKMPPTRITLTRTALLGARNLTVFCTGASKRYALQSVLSGAPLPVSTTADSVTEAGGRVEWLVDDDALPEKP